MEEVNQSKLGILNPFGHLCLEKMRKSALQNDHNWAFQIKCQNVDFNILLMCWCQDASQQK